MYAIVIGIQLISIIALTVECIVVFSAWRGRLQAFLFLGCVATLVNNLGYLLQLMSHSEESYFTALRLSYLGRVWVAVGLFLFIAELVKIKLPRVIGYLLGLASILIYLCVFTTKETGFYYKDMHFEMAGQLPAFEHTDAFGHTIFALLQAAYLLIGLFLLVSAMRKEHHPTTRKRYLMVMLAVLTEGAFVIVEMGKFFPALERVYDVTMLSFPIGVIFILIAIFRYNLLDTETLAREYVVDELSEGIIAVDEGGIVRYHNKPAKRIFPELLIKPQEVVARLNRSIKEEEPIRIEGRIYTPEKNELSRKRNTYGTVYSVIDDTEHYRYMEELKEQRSIADRANKAKSTFLASMSHEIRTPINAVLGMDEMILRETNEKETFSYAQDIHTAGSTLLSLINDILDFSKIEEGKMEILPTQYDLSSAVGDLVNMIRERAEKKGLAFHVEVDKETPYLLYGDEIRVKQIILNLLTNAVKYTKEGEVRLSVGYREAAEDEIFLEVRVSDTGIGMKEEDLEKLFSPFTRIEESRNRAIEGTGLGMSIVQQLLALMDSRLDVKSEYGKGSSFSFAIRQGVVKWDQIGDFTTRYQTRSSQSETYHELFHAPDARILVVDDTEVNLAVICNLLKKTKVKIDTAYSGPEALALAKEHDYDVVFIDHMMPDMDGVETLQHLKEQSEKVPPSIALTANAVSGAREEYLAAGFSDYLSKPVKGARLEEVLMEYLPPEKVLPPDVALTEESAPAPEKALPQEEEVSSAEPVADLPTWLLAIPEINPDTGIENCDDVESYLAVLSAFHGMAADKADEIEQHYRENDIENYTIKVHALKSSALIIGAEKLSAFAKELEEAGKAGDTEKIAEQTEELLRQYRALDAKLSPIDTE